MIAEPGSAFWDSQGELEGLVERGLASTSIARSRFLRWLGAGLFGAGVSAFVPAAARAESPDALAPCYGYPLCGTGGACCRSDLKYCDPHCNSGPQGCPTGQLCWNVCSSGTLYKCCDCKCSGCSTCICKFKVGTC